MFEALAASIDISLWVCISQIPIINVPLKGKTRFSYCWKNNVHVGTETLLNFSIWTPECVIFPVQNQECCWLAGSKSKWLPWLCRTFFFLQGINLAWSHWPSKEESHTKHHQTTEKELWWLWIHRRIKEPWLVAAGIQALDGHLGEGVWCWKTQNPLRVQERH